MNLSVQVVCVVHGFQVGGGGISTHEFIDYDCTEVVLAFDLGQTLVIITQANSSQNEH